MAAIAVVGVAVELGWLAPSPSPSGNGGGGLHGPTVAIAAAGTVWALGADRHEAVGPFDLTGDAKVTGSWRVSNQVDVVALVMTPAQQQSYGSCACLPGAFDWTSGARTAGSLDVALDPGSYYLDFANPDSSNSTSVQVLSELLATYTT